MDIAKVTTEKPCSKCGGIGDIWFPQIGSSAFCDCDAGREARLQLYPSQPKRAIPSTSIRLLRA